MNGFVMVSSEEYNELVLKAWKYDRLREKELKNTYHFNNDFDLYELTEEEKAGAENEAIRD